MIFLKWYNIVWNALAILCAFYNYGRDKDYVGFFIVIIAYLPLMVYLILS